jgi:hypothetical protein
MVRFISYLDPDVVLGGKIYEGSSPQTYECCVQRLSKNANDSTGFWVEQVGDAYRFKWAANPLRYLSWFNGPYHSAVLLDPFSQNYSDVLCKIDPVKDGNWFALNHSDKDFVLDCYGSDTTVGNRCGAWAWNGGDNQIWRTETVIGDRMYPKD